ncbi:MAG: RNA pseudouridine synthase [Alphaproteobacteria bacterium]|nr:RNA pseudouridine synthase [Alphaproteobacteria bacterium]
MNARPADFLLSRILYRDGLMLVIDKPAGLPVHAGPGGGDTLENYFDALKFGLPRPPALAHRLDRDTSGCLVLGRHPKALRKLGKLFNEGRVEKTYWAICKGAPEKLSGTIDAPLKKMTRGTGWRVEIAEDGQDARTTYRVLGSKAGLSFIEAKPKTGRTHQIRVHLASIGCPILGDPQYGDLSPEERAGPMMLHARRVVIPISKAKAPIVVEAPPPDAMALRLKTIGAQRS